MPCVAPVTDEKNYKRRLQSESLGFCSTRYTSESGTLSFVATTFESQGYCGSMSSGKSTSFT